jgi:hypothetical protein
MDIDMANEQTVETLEFLQRLKNEGALTHNTNLGFTDFFNQIFQNTVATQYFGFAIGVRYTVHNDGRFWWTERRGNHRRLRYLHQGVHRIAVRAGYGNVHRAFVYYAHYDAY